jgi:hypothetical protein
MRISEGVYDMRDFLRGQKNGLLVVSLVIFFALGVFSGHPEQGAQVFLKDILPVIEGMQTSGSPQTYFPETLFEYINGAAEIYLSYDFKELIVAEYKMSDSADSVAVEIYDMGDHKNSFGIYSAERYPDNEFLILGTQGYKEEGTMNFLIGRYYVKLLCFDCEDRDDKWLSDFSEGIVNLVENKEGFPAYLKAFPREGQVPNTEKFILRNVMGYKFLHDGYFVSYKMEKLSFDCFLIEGKSPEEATDMLNKYFEAKGAASVKKNPLGFLVKDRYYHNIYLSQVDNILCGVMKISDGFEEVGERYIAKLIESVKVVD